MILVYADVFYYIKLSLGDGNLTTAKSHHRDQFPSHVTSVWNKNQNFREVYVHMIRLNHRIVLQDCWALVEHWMTTINAYSPPIDDRGQTHVHQLTMASKSALKLWKIHGLWYISSTLWLLFLWRFALWPLYIVLLGSTRGMHSCDHEGFFEWWFEITDERLLTGMTVF